MPCFSIIIPVYNTQPYLDACLDSVRSQTFADWEAIVVIDASPDGAAAIANKVAQADSRFKVLEKPVNEGLHLARLSGLSEASGDYVVFLDSDDEFAPTLLEDLAAILEAEPVDILRFGCRVVNAGVSPEAARANDENLNRVFEPCTPREALALTYEEDRGYQLGWRAWGHVFSSSLMQRAGESLKTQRLDRAEDSFEFLVLLSHATSISFHTEVRGYTYYFGRGVCGDAGLPAETFVAHAGQFQACIQAIEDYAKAFKSFDLAPAASGARTKMIELLFNDWHRRVVDTEKLEAAKRLVDIVGVDTVAAEIMRIVRDDAYDSYVKGRMLPADAPLLQWHDFAEGLIGEGRKPLRYRQFADAAARHIADLRKADAVPSYAAQPIRIFVATHKPSRRFESSVLQPVQVGSVNAGVRFPDMLHDDEGDNISELNPAYCELTAQYWAWKNIDADYYGFCHYRRYFNFSAERYAENAWGEIMEAEIDAVSQAKFGLSDENIRDFVGQYDVITTESKDLRAFPDEAQTAFEHWHAAQNLYDKDLISVLAILVERHPDYLEDVIAYLDGNHSRFCNMFVMRKDIFQDYCAWLFPLLEEFMGITDMATYSQEALRTPGHLSERLLNIYLNHHRRIGADWRMKEVQCVHFERTDPVQTPVMLSPLETCGKPVIPVVLAADNNYVPMLTTTLYSMLRNASPDYHYHILVLTEDISWKNRVLLRDYVRSEFPAWVDYYDVSPLLANYKLGTNNPHIGVETYYRFLIQDLLPFYDKVLYLDSDLIIEGDVAELFETELGENLVAAVRDIDYLGNLNKKDGQRLAYTREVLGMENPYDYFQAGVLLLNTYQLRRLCSVADLMEQAQDERYIYNDQDILNSRCEGRVVFLDPAWNVMHDCYGRIQNFFAFAPAEVFADYNRARTAEKVIHYAGFQKPWNTPDCDRAERYWAYARQTPFYEKLLALLMEVVSCEQAPAIFEASRALRLDMPVISQRNPVRKVLDPLMPLDSPQREAARRLMQRLKGVK